MYSASYNVEPDCTCQFPPEADLQFKIIDAEIEGYIDTSGAVNRGSNIVENMQWPECKSQKIVNHELQALLKAYPSSGRPQFAHKKYRKVNQESIREKHLPGVLDDFYLNVLDWGSVQGASRLAIACMGEVVILDDQLNALASFKGRVGGAASPTHRRAGTTLSSVLASTLSGIVGNPPDTSALDTVGIQLPLPDRNPHTTMDDGVVAASTPQLRLPFGASRTPSLTSAAVLRRNSELSPLSGDRMEYTSVRWSHSGQYLALGTRSGDIEIWDPVTQQISMGISSHCQRVGVLDWVPGDENQFLLTSGSRDKTLMVHDLRVRSVAIEIDKHKQEVCGLAWRPANQRDDSIVSLPTAPEESDMEVPKSANWRCQKGIKDSRSIMTDETGNEKMSYWDLIDAEYNECRARPETNLEETRAGVFSALKTVLSTESPLPIGTGGGTRNSVPTLASGGNDNKIYLWELGQTVPIVKFAEHTAAVKALAWAPTKHGVLASGGGTNDRTIRLWDTEHKLDLCSSETESQVCNLTWSPVTLELLSSHGYTLNQVNLWDLKLRQSNKVRLRKAATLTGHTSRVLFMSPAPDQSHVATVGGDGTLKVWNVFSNS